MFVMWFIPNLALSQLCEPIYKVEKSLITGSATGQMTSNEYNTIATIGQPLTTFSTTTNYTYKVTTGFWSYYLTEPAAPLVWASDGDYQDFIFIEWNVEGDRTGPKVTSDEVTLYRNGYALTTLPLTQTQYLDFNVFSGMYYTYGVSVENSMGESPTDDDVGFLNPNGMITGHVSTPSGNPVINTKVKLTPNLGRSAKFNGDGYIFWFDNDINTNRQFTCFENDYTIETWFRSVELTEQVFFAAVDSNTTNHYITLGLTEEGKVTWTHQPSAGEAGTEIVTVGSYAGPGEDWHHLAVVYADSNASMTMYIDGFLVGEATASGKINDKVEIVIGKRGPREPLDYFKGRLDDIRLWAIPREWDDLRKMMDITLSGEEDNLAAYWKFDEVEGEVVFDLTNADFDGEICNIERDNLIAPVFLGALTDDNGNYAIKGIYYGDGTVFTVTPGLSSPIGRSLEFDGVDDYIRFQGQRVDLTAGYTLEGWFKTPSSGNHTIFAAVDPADDSHRFSVTLVNGQVKAAHFATEITSTAFNDNLWHHYAVTNDNTTLTLYVDGEEIGSEIITQVIPDPSEIVIARTSPGQSGGYFQGRLDEIRLWGVGRSAEQVGGTMNQVLDGDNYGLIDYWRMNEGVDSLITDATGTVTGTIVGADPVALKNMWNNDIPLNEYFDHWYEPESRQATLNASNTSVDLVDFTDESLIPVSGYVRYSGTACFQEGVEILLNGESFIPPIYTDADGKFIVELEPGAVGQRLSCRYKTPGSGVGDIAEEFHEFIPQSIELPMMVQPISGLFFDDRTTRVISGVVGGGDCKYPINPSQGQIEVTFHSVSGCIEETIIPDLITGAYVSPDLPPLEFQVTVNHPDPNIEFDGRNVSLVLENKDSLDFIYYSNPVVRIDGMPENECNTRVMEMNASYPLTINVFEEYVDHASGTTYLCPVDTGSLQVFNNLKTTPTVEEYTFGGGQYDLSVTPGQPNILGGGAHPYQKSIQVVATTPEGLTTSTTEWTIVTGDKPRNDAAYATTTPAVPLMIIHAPPGNESVAYWSQNTTYETAVSFSAGFTSEVEKFTKVSQGVDVVTEAGTPFFSTEIEVDATLDFTETTTVTQRLQGTQELGMSLESTETISTTTGGDVFMGGAINLLYGITDLLRITDSCEVEVKPSIIIVPTGFATTYIYSEYQILNSVIPNLETIGDTASIAMWQSFLAMNQQNRANAEFVENVSFDAGTVYESEQTNTLSENTTVEFEHEVTQEFAAELGLTTNGVGVNGGVKTTFGITFGMSATAGYEESNTFGYALADADIGDNFTLDIKKDKMYGSPVFVTISGFSSCPWEANTVPFDQAALSINSSLEVDVPPDDPAVFTLNLGNLSPAEADREYQLRMINVSNPDAAFIIVNGYNIADGLSFFIPYGQNVEATMEVYRGPEAYKYDNLQIQLVPPCEYELWENGFALQLADTVDFSVHFQEPCSESQITSPEDGWLIDSSHESDTLWVTVTGYNWPADTFMTSIDLQYRAGVGDWFTAYSVPTDSLIDDYVLMPFNISENIIIDGSYELRAQAQCTGGKYPGTSQVVSGLIDRSAPQVLGLPEPVDGILGPDDLIRVTFNEEVACGEINPGAGDIMLYNTVTGNPMDYTYTCGDNVITFEPNVTNMFLENQIFRCEIHNLQDMYGNTRAVDDPIIWEFFVNRNPLEWSGTNVDNVVIQVDEEYTTTRTITNNGGSNRSWEIIGGREGAIPGGTPLDLPTWLDVSPMSGTLTPGARQDITIALSEGLDFGEYSTTIYAAGTMGDEPMVVDIRKLCYEPDWDVNAADYQYSMAITATLSTEDGLSEDIYDRIVVLHGEEIRGVGDVIYLPELENVPNTHPYEVFLTVYSNESSGEELSLRVWDASQCMELGWIELGWADSSTTFQFKSNTVLGTPSNPEAILATNQIISSVYYPAGWTWFSLNLNNEDMTVNNLLANMSPVDGDIIRDQVSFSQFVSEYNGTPVHQWVGTLTEISNQTMAMIKLTNPDTLQMVGYAVDTELDTIEITSGWNWIGYTPQVSYPVDYALNSLPSATGDVIKNQFAYAQYVEGLGWIGNLTYMNPKLGYMLKSYYSGELLYPFYPPPVMKLIPKGDFEPKLARGTPDWNVVPGDYEYSMNITGQLITHDSLSTDAYDLIGAFVGTECRGIAQPVYIEALDKYLVFMTVYGTGIDPETIEFQSYNADLDEILYVDETVDFVPNGVVGNITEPFTWNARYLRIGDEGYIPDVYSLAQNYPNPFNPVTTIAYGLPEESDVTITIYNLLGQKVAALVNERQEPGYYFIRWNSVNTNGIPVSAGIYIYQIRANDYVKTRKLVLLK